MQEKEIETLIQDKEEKVRNTFTLQLLLHNNEQWNFQINIIAPYSPPHDNIVVNYHCVYYFVKDGLVKQKEIELKELRSNVVGGITNKKGAYL